ncbi:predicted protein [Thalassiosira pseudonana CCMP1335]|uniref:HSF-type DNA-binding domain-containing protein n=1 Tax=Thalassiosira pseudonana TaxID=35128 RepID=B5YLJ5_THAPS|nr:predicted protein [Thalassiosira pseudonana CCMP1335]ACI64090.1 predicted protein [Thalassiosira pseudonana CCMP1335]
MIEAPSASESKWSSLQDRLESCNSNAAVEDGGGGIGIAAATAAGGSAPLIYGSNPGSNVLQYSHASRATLSSMFLHQYQQHHFESLVTMAHAQPPAFANFAPTAPAPLQLLVTTQAQRQGQADDTTPAFLGKSSFPLNLSLMLESVDSLGLSHIVSWLQCGTCFCIHDNDAFMREVLPKFFGSEKKETKIRSFNRKLNRWGFAVRRSSSQLKSPSLVQSAGGPTKGAWYHPEFFRTRAIKCLKEAMRTGDSSCFVLSDPNPRESPSSVTRRMNESSAGGRNANRRGEKVKLEKSLSSASLPPLTSVDSDALSGYSSSLKSNTDGAFEQITSSGGIDSKIDAAIHKSRRRYHSYGAFNNHWATNAIANANTSTAGDADVFEPLPSSRTGIIATEGEIPQLQSGWFQRQQQGGSSNFSSMMPLSFQSWNNNQNVSTNYPSQPSQFNTNQPLSAPPVQNQQQQHGRNLTEAEEDAAISLFLQNFDYTMDRDEDDIL